MEASKQPGSNGHSGRSSYVSSDVPEFESSTLFDQPQVNSFDVLSILRPSCALKDAVEALETRLEARALFESPQHLKDLPLPDEIKAFIRVLKNPKTGGVVYLLGTLHFSKASVDDGRMLIEAVQPDVVALEVRNRTHRK